MTAPEIKKFLEAYVPKKERTIVIVDFSNVEKWKNALGWKVGVRELAKLVKHFSLGERYLRRFYYGSDFGPDNSSEELIVWSKETLDVEMTVDLIREVDNYDTIILFSGDGDLMYAVDYLNKEYGKECFVFGARGFIGKEVFDAHSSGLVSDVFFAEDFESRLRLQIRRR